MYLAKWQETDVAVKVITEMQKPPPLRETQVQGQTSMQPYHVCGKQAKAQAAGQAEGLGNQHGLQGQCHSVGHNLAASNESKVNIPSLTSKLGLLDQQSIHVCVCLCLCLDCSAWTCFSIHQRHNQVYASSVHTGFGSLLLSMDAA